MNKLSKLTISLLILMLAQGCAPAFRPVIPEVHGKVIDKQTHDPVPNAQISLQIKGEPEVRATSDDSGMFHIEERKTLTIVPLFLVWDFTPPFGILVISADGYAELSTNEFGFPETIIYKLESSAIMTDSSNQQL